MQKNRIVNIAILFGLIFFTACNQILKTPQAQLTKPTDNIPVTSPSQSNSNPAPQPTNPPQVTPTADNAMGEMAMGTPSSSTPNTIKISDQPITRGTVMVDEVMVTEPSWIVIYTTNASGQPDQPIGHAALAAGDNRNVMVEIDGAKTTEKLYAQVHVDRGTIGAFEFPGPDEPLMSGIQMISQTFKVVNTGPTADQPAPTGKTPAIIVANQPLKNGTVTIPEVISNGETWLVVHRQNGDGTMGSMVGYAKIQDGINKNVVVTLDTKNTSTIMYAMLHENNAKMGSPQFPGVDVPIMANGQMINPTFEITPGNAADVFISLGNKPETVSSLVDGNNMSLYVSLRDAPGRSTCSEDCLKVWRPLLATGRLIAGDGVDSKKLSVILLPNGSRQVTYLGAPLYLYTRDEKPGDVNGQGLDGTWYLVTP